ncbi:hypothetical protein [Caballeronia insecticola]|uniref:hypothetical protein n=1 Tax=Caballeronia insecticola TaxID=758793 RepID=UPI0011838212|nr:hypothetical protein [Caballeronia insecticola]
MEGIRRIGVLINVVAILWVAVFLWLAAAAAIGTDVPLTDEQKATAFERDTGKKLALESLKHPSVTPRQYSALDELLADAGREPKDINVPTGEILARFEERQRILDGYFSSHPATVRLRHWGDVQAYLIFAAIGSAILGAIGWVVTGFAIVRRTS